MKFDEYFYVILLCISNVIDENIFLEHIYIFYDVLADTSNILTQGCIEFRIVF